MGGYFYLGLSFGNWDKCIGPNRLRDMAQGYSQGIFVH
jgi:hypothetical protein